MKQRSTTDSEDDTCTVFIISGTGAVSVKVPEAVVETDPKKAEQLCVIGNFLLGINYQLCQISASFFVISSGDLKSNVYEKGPVGTWVTT